LNPHSGTEWNKKHRMFHFCSTSVPL
jgi:hypothetical protein